MRHLRLRQVLIAQGYTGKELRKAVAFEHRNWKEDNESLPTIKQVRKMHETLGTWDKLAGWQRILHTGGFSENRIMLVDRLGDYQFIYPKANYKPIKKVSLYINNIKVAECPNTLNEAQELRWKEQEKRTLEFFEREGC